MCDKEPAVFIFSGAAGRAPGPAKKSATYDGIILDGKHGYAYNRRSYLLYDLRPYT